MKQIDNLRTRIGTEYLSSDAQADGYTVYLLDDAPNTRDTAPNDYIIIADGIPYFVQTDILPLHPIIINILDTTSVSDHIDNGNAIASWMHTLV